jgi:ribonuclease HI
MKIRMFVGSFAKEQMGGYAASLFAQMKDGIKSTVVEGTKLGTTTNEMDLIAIRDGLKKINQGVRKDTLVHIETRNRYASNVFNEWLEGWKASGWKKKDKSEIKNLDIIQEIDSLMEEYKVVRIQYEKDDKFLSKACDRAREVYESLAE